jgi:hypothetical protein
MQDIEKCATENKTHMKAITRKLDTKKHKAKAKTSEIKGNDSFH